VRPNPSRRPRDRGARENGDRVSQVIGFDPRGKKREIAATRKIRSKNGCFSGAEMPVTFMSRRRAGAASTLIGAKDRCAPNNNDRPQVQRKGTFSNGAVGHSERKRVLLGVVGGKSVVACFLTRKNAQIRIVPKKGSIEFDLLRNICWAS